LGVTDRAVFREALGEQDVDVLIHLAANPSPYADWDDLKEVNLDGVYNAYEAAVGGDISRVVYASSNHAVDGDGLEDPAEPETMTAEAPTVYPHTPPKPDSYYGVTKVAGETIGGYYARRRGLEVINVRIGWIMTEDELKGTQGDLDTPYPEAAARFARAMWLSPRDCRRALRAAATSEVNDSPVVAHAVSRNGERYLSLTSTCRTLGYRPWDNSGEAL
jgi:L-arabinose 1-dehydrogenase [NAD(P)+]